MLIYGDMVFNCTINNISVIPWRSVLLVEKTGENQRPVASHCQTLSHNAGEGSHSFVISEMNY